MKIAACVIVLASLCATQPCLAETAQETFDRNLENAREVDARLRADADREAMRDKSHDNRLPVADGVSVGVDRTRDGQGGEVNVKIDLDRPER